MLQYLEGTLPKSGLWYQGNVVEPKRMLSDIEGLGVQFEIKKMTDFSSPERSLFLNRSD
ncbi:MAG: hypothetical protein HC877_14255 [Thioploca sp.]|nr:hypothetical protein [Thioploca sp.]